MLELVIPAARLLRPVSSLIFVIFVQAMPGGPCGAQAGSGCEFLSESSGGELRTKPYSRTRSLPA